VVSSTPRPHFTPGKDPVPILHEVGWAPGPIGTGRKSRPHWESIPNRPARIQPLYRLNYPSHDHSPVTVKLYATQHDICTQSSNRTFFRKMDAMYPSETSVNLNENTRSSISKELFTFQSQLFSFWLLT